MLNDMSQCINDKYITAFLYVAFIVVAGFLNITQYDQNHVYQFEYSSLFYLFVVNYLQSY